MIKHLLLSICFLQFLGCNTYANNQQNIQRPIMTMQEAIEYLQKEINIRKWTIFKSYLKQVPLQLTAYYCMGRGARQTWQVLEGKIKWNEAPYLYSFLLVIEGWQSLSNKFTQSREQARNELERLEAELNVYSQLQSCH